MSAEVPKFTRSELRRYLAGLPRQTRWKILRRGAHHETGLRYLLFGFAAMVTVLLAISWFIEPMVGTLNTSAILMPIFVALVLAFAWFARRGSELALVRSLNALEPAERSVARASLAAGRLVLPDNEETPESLSK